MGLFVEIARWYEPKSLKSGTDGVSGAPAAATATPARSSAGTIMVEVLRTTRERL